jgi:outer membrane protein OmpA-like peptidoglycan-associated protein
MKKYVTLILVLMTALIFGQNSPGQYTVKNAKINTQSSDFGTAFFGTDKVVFASPKKGFTLNREENTSQPFLDLYIGEVTEDGQIVKKQKLKGDINSKYHEGMVSFTKDMKTVYFSANNYIKKKKNKEKNKSTKFLQLFKASVTEDGEWTNLTLLPLNGTNFSSGHPVLNKDDNQLYFVSDRPESIGKTDLFVVDIYEDGSYSEPRNLGPQINTKEREMFPFIGVDNVLYFSSDGYPGHGELDVYASKIFDSTVSEPINLEEPVNSEYDDFAYIINDDKHRGYFSSNREGGHGDDDIYSFTASPPIYIECMQKITGVVRDIETQNLVPDVMIVLYDAKGLELQSFISSKEEGSFNFQQPCNATYMIKGYLEGYLVGELDIKTVNDLNADPIEITLELMSDQNKKDKVIADLNPEGVEEQIYAAGEEETTDFSSKSEEENAHAEQKSKVNPTGTTLPNTETVAVGAVPVMKSVTETKSDDAIIATTSTSTPEAATSVNKADSAIEPDNSIVVESDSSNNNVSENKVIDVAAENAIAVNTKSTQVSTKSAVVPVMVAAAENEEAETVALTAAVNVEKAGASVSKSNPTVESDVSKGNIVANTQDHQKESLTAVYQDKQEVKAQKSIAMDMSQDNRTSQDGVADFQSEGANDQVIHINTIYFDYDKYDIRFDAKIELEKIAVVLKENPETKIKVNAHTDVRGKKSYNLKLSKSRAYSTVQYLLNKGIDEERISSEGHGETHVAEECTKERPCTGLQHQLNRRSEFLIVDKFSDAIVAQSINKMASGNYAVNEKVSNSGLYLNYDFSGNREMYTVQVGAFKGKVQTDKYSKLTDLFNYRYNDGLNRYYAGIFETSSEARSYMNKMRKQGFKDAFVVGLKGESRF